MEMYALKNMKITDSSSGAAFPTIIAAIKKMYEDKEVVVYGAAFDDDLNVIHMRETTEEGFYKFRGSKYVESDLTGIFENVLKDLITGNSFVIFSGTPCQGYALDAYLRRHNCSRMNLLIVDLVCHGVGRKDVWNDFKAWLEKKESSQLSQFRFRYPYTKWQVNPVMAKFKNGKMAVNTFFIRRYMKLYQANLIMKPSCYNCKLMSLDRKGDITIGDFWRVGEALPQFPDQNKVSQVMINSALAELVLVTIRENFCDEVVVEKVINLDLAEQWNMSHSTERPKDFQEFEKIYSERGFEAVLKQYAEYSIVGYIKHILGKIRASIRRST